MHGPPSVHGWLCPGFAKRDVWLNRVETQLFLDSLLLEIAVGNMNMNFLILQSEKGLKYSVVGQRYLNYMLTENSSEVVMW